MKKYAILFGILLIYQAQATAYDWADKDFTVVEETKGEDRTVVILQDKEGKQFTVGHSIEIDNKMAKKIIELKDRMYGFQNIKVSTLRFEYSKDALEISLVPEAFSYKNVNILDYLPAGLLFTYYDELQYNFRITRNNVFARVYGEFVSEQELCDKTLEAVTNPHVYIRKRDPEYLLLQLNRLTNAFIASQNKGAFGGAKPIDEKAIEMVVATKKKHPDMKSSAIVKELKKQGVKITEKEVSIILNVYFNIFE